MSIYIKYVERPVREVRLGMPSPRPASLKRGKGTIQKFVGNLAISKQEKQKRQLFQNRGTRQLH
jgi:hypothetical protein